MSDDTPEDLTVLAKEYLNDLESDHSREPEELRENAEYWEAQVREFEEGTPMHAMATEEHDEAKKRLDAIETKGKRHEEVRTELLTRTSKEFAPQGEWLEADVVEALSHALIGRRMGRLLIGNHTLPDDAEELSKREMVPVAKTVHALAGDAIGSDERIAGLWNKINTETQRAIIEVLAQHEEPLSSSEISGKIGEDGTDNPGANIRYLRGEVDFDPYLSTNGGYTLTLAGRYVWNQYGPDIQEPAEESDGQDTLTKETKSEEPAVSEKEETTNDDEPTNSAPEVDLSTFEVKE